MYEIIEKLKKEIEGFEEKEKGAWEKVGRVVEVGDGIVKIAGLKDTLSQEVLSIETDRGNVAALALNLDEDAIGALLLEEGGAIKSVAKIFLGNIFSARYFARKIPPSECPTNTTSGEFFLQSI